MFNALHLKLFAAEDCRHSFRSLNSPAATRTESFITRAARYALVRTGKAIGFFLPRANRSGIFFFFPFQSIGGAEKVHAEIVACVEEQKAWVFFTNESENLKFKFLFKNSARIFDISRLAAKSFTYYLTLGVLTTLINRHPNAVVFGSNNVLFYHLISYLRKDVRRIDLVHGFGGGIEHVSLPFVNQIDVRVMINRQTLLDLKNQYAFQGIDPQLFNRVTLIENCVPVPDIYPAKCMDNRLRVLYVGRGSKEKRVHLVGRAAERCRQMGIPAEFVFVGNVIDAVERNCRSAAVFAGEIEDPKQLAKFYKEADVLVLTSTFEGFPVVIMEAMAHGIVPVSTAVGGIPFHVKHGVNGLLIKDEDEAGIVQSLANEIKRLAENRALLQEMSRQAYEHARRHFTPPKFRTAYRQLLLQPLDNK